MKKLIIAFLLLLFAVWLGFLIHRDPGYILITYHNWSIETSLWVGIVIALVAFLIFYFLLRLFRHTSRLGSNLQIWNKERRERKAGEQTNDAFNALIEMEWERAEHLFSKSAKDSTSPVINYSAAAYAAQQLMAFDRRNKYLTKLAKQKVSSRKTAHLVESYFYLQSEQWKEAVTLLRALEKKYPRDTAVIRFLAKTLEGLEDWESLKQLLPALEKTASKKDYQTVATKLYCALLIKAIHPEQLDQLWNETPKAIKTTKDLAYTYGTKAQELRRDTEAVDVIETALKKDWDERLIDIYGTLKTDKTAKQISHAESWLKKHPNNAAILLCLGRLCIQEKLWGKARDYLTNARDLSNAPETYAALSALYVATDDPAAALENFQKAMPPSGAQSG